MSQTVEDFVAKLQTEGVDEGRKQADAIRQQATQDAEKALADARRQAEKIVADAESQAQATLQRGQTELKLACRDAVLELREALARAIQVVLSKTAADKLQDADFIGPLLHEIVMSYVKAEQDSRPWIAINTPQEMRESLRDWALRELGREKVDSIRGSFDLQSTLAQAGFEYSVHGSTVEVTVDSVVAALSEMLSPQLRDMLDAAMREKGSQE